MLSSRIAIAVALAAIHVPVAAQSATFDSSATETGGGTDPAADSTTEKPTPGSAEDAHRDDNNAIVVTGIRRREADVLGGISVLDQAELTREVRPSIGETLARQPGVTSTSFGPQASAPVLRGLSGDRVRVLTDGIGTLDLASSGPDHAIAINPLTAQSIEVLRGPSALLFGSSAIGGVVNVIDTRIPRRLPGGGVGGDALVGYGTAADERLVNGAIDVSPGGGFVVHADGNWMKTDDLRTGGHILSKELREEALASPDPEIQSLANLKGDLPNSASDSKEGALGVAYVGADGLNVGASVTRHLSTYQVPIRYSLDPAIEPEAPTIDVKQTRYDARASIPIGGFFSELRARGGYSNYHHDEIADTGQIGSSFFSKGAEGRVELAQTSRAGWEGTSGIQYLNRTAKIRGDEKFLPDSRQKQTGLFTVQTLVTGAWRLEGGARIEFSDLTAKADQQLATPGLSRTFTTLSGSIGSQYEFASGWRAGLSLSRTARAPSVDELFANGPHGGSQTFEVGDPNLSSEKSLGVEASLRKTKGSISFTGNLFYTHFANYIFQSPTGAVEDDLPVFQARNGQANFYGFEVQTSAQLGELLGVKLGGELQGDAVHATVKSFGPAPFMPPLRILGALTGERGQVDGRLEVERAFAHDRTAPIETDTPGYTMVNASLDWHVFEANPALSLSLQANNLFDVDARRSTSQLKDFAPLAGRDIRLSARVGF